MELGWSRRCVVPAGGGVQVHYMRTYLFPWINTTSLISLSNCPAVVCCQSFHPFRMGFHPNDTSAYLVFFLPLNIPVMLFAAECGAELCCSVDQVVPSVSILMVLQPQVPQGSLQVAVFQLYSLSFGADLPWKDSACFVSVSISGYGLYLLTLIKC